MSERTKRTGKAPDAVVERLEFECSYTGMAIPEPNPEGRFVYYEDFRETLNACMGHFEDAVDLAKELIDAKVENKRLRKQIERLEAKLDGRLL